MYVSKKPRKQRKRKQRTPNLPKEVISSAASKSPTERAGLRKMGDFNPDYSYVIKDLRRIGILAGSFIVILIILSVVLG
jgi:hypothetical protein